MNSQMILEDLRITGVKKIVIVSRKYFYGGRISGWSSLLTQRGEPDSFLRVVSFGLV